MGAISIRGGQHTLARQKNTKKLRYFRVNLGPHEDIAKIYVMDQGRTPEIRQEGSHTLLHAKEYTLEF